MVVVDCADAGLLEGLKRAVTQFAAGYALHARPADDLRLGLCGLAATGGRVQLQARARKL